jgi:hypothetical protein
VGKDFYTHGLPTNHNLNIISLFRILTGGQRVAAFRDYRTCLPRPQYICKLEANTKSCPSQTCDHSTSSEALPIEIPACDSRPGPAASAGRQCRGRAVTRQPEWGARPLSGSHDTCRPLQLQVGHCNEAYRLRVSHRLQLQARNGSSGWPAADGRIVAGTAEREQLS